MAGRNLKKGLSYFSVEVGIMHDKRVRRLDRRYPDRGVVVYLAILAFIYGDNGYYAYLSDDFTDDIAEDVRVEDANTILDIIEECVNCNLFDKSMYQINGVLTSEEIQAGYIRALKAMKRKGCVNEFRLLAYDEVEKSNTSENFPNDFAAISEQMAISSRIVPEQMAISSRIVSEQMAISSRIVPEQMAISSDIEGEGEREEKRIEDTPNQPQDKLFSKNKKESFARFMFACERAKDRDAAAAATKELQSLDFFMSAEYRSATLSTAERFMFWVWLYYANLQYEFEQPLILSEAKTLFASWHKEDVQRIVERIANDKSVSQNKKSFFLTVKDWLRTDFKIQKSK